LLPLLWPLVVKKKKLQHRLWFPSLLLLHQHLKPQTPPLRQSLTLPLLPLPLLALLPLMLLPPLALPSLTRPKALLPIQPRRPLTLPPQPRSNLASSTLLIEKATARWLFFVWKKLNTESI